MSQERPVNLNLFKFHFPVMAISSILHRISGVILFLLLPAMLYGLHQSLISRDSFSFLRQCLGHTVSKVILLAVIASAIYHLFAGVRHLLMDCGVAESKRAGAVTAWLVIVLTIIVVAWMGVRIW